jgi:hypothetical protein
MYIVSCPAQHTVILSKLPDRAASYSPGVKVPVAGESSSQDAHAQVVKQVTASQASVYCFASGYVQLADDTVILYALLCNQFAAKRVVQVEIWSNPAIKLFFKSCSLSFDRATLVAASACTGWPPQALTCDPQHLHHISVK